MNLRNIFWPALAAVVCVAGCSGKGPNNRDRIGSLNRRHIQVKEPVLEDSFEKAMQAYRKFLEEGSDGQEQVTAEAMRRLADLQLEAGAGTFDFVKQAQQTETPNKPAANGVKQESIAQFGKSQVQSDILQQPGTSAVKGVTESQQAFEQRTTRIADMTPATGGAIVLPDSADGEEVVVNANTDEAIRLYRQLLEKYPLYERNDQVMYQLARAYEDGARQEEAKAVLDQLVIKYPDSVHYDEAQFRRGEIFFVRKQYFDSEKAYTEVIRKGESSAFYDQSLFKRGWSLFKQSLHEEALDDFMILLDMKTAAGYHIQTEANKTEYQRVEDTFRVVSLSFSYLGDVSYINNYFERNGHRDYEYLVYTFLGEHYLEKRRYQDAAGAYQAFIALYPLHEKAPEYHMHTIEIFRKGQFPQLVIDAKREFAGTYALNSTYWTYHDINAFPGIKGFIKTNLQDLAKHYHALSQRERKPELKREAYVEAVRWYRGFLASFPEDETAAEFNFLLAELLFENKAYKEAAEEYERTAYAYPLHPKAAESGYAAVLSFREYENEAPVHMRLSIHRELIRSSLQFADTYPAHPQAAAVLTNAAESLYALKEYDRAIDAGQNVLQNHKDAEPKLITASWIVLAHSTFELKQYTDAEKAYDQVLVLLPRADSQVAPIMDKLAASIYKQAEQHQQMGELEEAVEDYLRIADAAPQSPIRQTAEYDAATALIKLENWERSATVLQAFRKQYPKSELQFDITQKLAFVYQKNGKSIQAAQEFERIAEQSTDTAIRKEALLESARLYAVAAQYPTAINVYKTYIKSFPEPIEPALEARNEMVRLYEKTGQDAPRFAVLKEIVDIDLRAGQQRTDRTKYLGAKAAFVLIDPVLQDFRNARLGEPFKKTLRVKKEKMEKALKLYGGLADYGVGEITAAATYQIAGIYYKFSRDLLESERPKNLSSDELEQYELILEEQAYPFEEKAIAIHEKNLELMTAGVFNEWIDKSIAQLGNLMPARYGKKEQGEQYVSSIY